MQSLNLNEWVALFKETENMKTTERELISKKIIKAQ